jgi:hypothetical protein
MLCYSLLVSHKAYIETVKFYVTGVSYGIYRCPGRNVKNFGRMFLILKYTDIT